MISTNKVDLRSLPNEYFDSLVFDVTDNNIYFKDNENRICKQKGNKVNDVFIHGHIGEVYLKFDQRGCFFVVGRDGVYQFKGELTDDYTLTNYGNNFVVMKSLEG